MLVGINDVSERFSLIKAFEYQQNLLDNILSTSTDALVVFDGRGCVELFSPAAESMFGRTSTEMIIDEVHSLFDGPCHERVNAIFNHLKAMECADDILVFEDLLPVKSNGEVFPASITFSRSKKQSDPLFLWWCLIKVYFSVLSIPSMMPTLKLTRPGTSLMSIIKQNTYFIMIDARSSVSILAFGY